MIDTQALREKILDLAMRGKLVPQDPADEPARVLLDRIKAEKEELIKAKKIKRDKNESEIFTSDDGFPYEKFKDGTSKPIDLPYDLPAGWELELFKNTAYIVRGGSPRPIKNYLTTEQNGINWIKIGDTSKDGKYIESTAEKITPEGLKKTRQVYKGDFLLSNSMSFGRPYILKLDGAIHDGWLAIQYYETVFDTEFLYYLISSNITQSQFYKTASGTAVKNLNSDKVGQTILFVPPLAEQERIVAKINQLFDLVDRIEREQKELQELSKQLKQKVLDVAMQGKLVPQDPTDEPASVLLEKIRDEKQKLFEAGKIKKKDLVEVPISDVGCAPYGKLPKGWEMARLSNLGIIQTGTTPSKNNKKNYGGDYPFFKPSDLSQGINLTIPSERLSEEGFKAARKLHKGSILVNSIGNIGVVALLQINGAFNQQINGIEPFEGVFSEFLFWLLQSQNSQRQMLEKSSATTISILNKSKFSEVFIPLAPLLEQQRIAEKIKQIVLELNQFD